MPIIVRLDRVLADRKMPLTVLAEKVGISLVNLSNLKTGKVKAIRFSTRGHLPGAGVPAGRHLGVSRRSQ